MRCMICSMQCPGRGIPCKLCGMKSECPVESGGFSFCCQKCARHFSEILEKSPPDEVDGLVGMNPVI